MADIRILRAEDIPFGLRLCRIAQWNQLQADWRHLLALEPDGVFLATEGDRRCGTATTTSYGSRTAWIGMVLVHPDCRRRGIGSALMRRAIEHLRGRRIESIKLDATDQGRPVYVKLGFKDERPICRYAGPRPQTIEAAAGAARPIRLEDWPAVARMDQEAFGADRTRLLRLLAADGPSALVADGDEVRAYGFAGPGHEGAHLGPVVAADPDAARQVAAALFAALRQDSVYWDVLPDNAEAVRLAEGLGLAVARRLTRMVLGEKVNPGCAPLVYAAAGFELG